MPTRSPPTDRFVLPDSWEALARKVRIRGGLHQRDPANYPRIKIGRFDAQVRIGEGGFGMVFKVFDPEFERWVALKLCLARSPSATEGLMEEARTLAELNHPNIVTVYEPGEHEGVKFFVMPYIDGHNAAQFAKREPRPSWRQTVEIYIGVAKGLAAAHHKGIVHGDVKPSNILIDLDGFARIADFGLARRAIEDADESEQEGLRHRAGTLYYMAPEVLAGGRGDALSDQFSFFVALAQTLGGGALPFEGETSGELLEAIKCTEVRFEDPAIPQALVALVRVGLSEDRSERFANMDQVVAELERVLRSEEAEAAVVEPSAAEGPPALEPRWGVYVVSLLLGMVGVALGWLGRGQVVEPASETVPLPSSPCAGTSVDVDPRVLPACTFIREGKLREANDYWAQIYNWRWDALQSPGPHLQDSAAELAVDTMIIVETYRDQAKRLAGQAGKHAEAANATQYSNEWTAVVDQAWALGEMSDSTNE